MKIGVYLGSFSPMHKGHEAVIKQAAALNDVLLLFPGLGAKGAKKGTKTVNKVKMKKFTRLPGQTMVTSDVKKAQLKVFRELLSAGMDVDNIQKIKIVMPGEIVGGFTAAPAPVANVYGIVGSLAEHYRDFGGVMKGVDFPFLGLVDDPEVYLYSDSSVEDLSRTGPPAFKRSLPGVRKGEIEPEVIDALFDKGIVNSVGVRRGGTQETESELDFPVSYVDFETPDVSSTKLRKMIFDLRNAASDDERTEKIMQIADLLPDTFPMERKLNFIKKLSGLDIERGNVFIAGKEAPDFVFEIKRAEKGTSEYSTYLDEVIDELHHLKSSYGSRTKVGSRYRKEAHQIQSAISAIRHMKRSNDKIIHSNDQALNERVVRKIVKERQNIEEESFDRDVLKDFFRKFRK